jgi:dTDP-4-dehydrorhamnose reductase
VKLVLTGANGQLGAELCNNLAPLGDVFALDRSQCDLARAQSLPAVIRAVNADVIVNAAAYTAVDRAETEEKLAFTVNAEAAGILADEARRSGALLVHYSTDYVFDGQKPGLYDEDDAPAPLNAYGRSKLAGEIAVRHCAGDYLIFRASWIYAARGQNFLRTILRLAQEKEELQIVADQIGAPTWAREIAKATARAIAAATAERRGGGFKSGIFHLTATGAASWYDFAAAIVGGAVARGLLPHPPRLRAITSAQYPQAARRPENCRLDCGRIRQRFGIVLPEWQAMLAGCLDEIAAPAAASGRG